MSLRGNAVFSKSVNGFVEEFFDNTHFRYRFKPTNDKINTFADLILLCIDDSILYKYTELSINSDFEILSNGKVIEDVKNMLWLYIKKIVNCFFFYEVVDFNRSCDFVKHAIILHLSNKIKRYSQYLRENIPTYDYLERKIKLAGDIELLKNRVFKLEKFSTLSEEVEYIRMKTELNELMLIYNKDFDVENKINNCKKMIEVYTNIISRL